MLPTSTGTGSGEPVPTTSEFDIELVFEGLDDADPIVEEAFEAARERWQRVIVGDLLDVELQQPVDCMGVAVSGDVDDLVIFVSVVEIDGPQGVLGAAAPCLLRARGTNLPFAGRMEFDSADLLYFAEAGRLEEIVLHEMGHVLGIGPMWQVQDMLQDPAVDQGGGQDTSFEGALAIEAFDAAGGTDYSGSKVPVENTGGEGVANGHWRESVLGNELMTPFMSELDGKLSRITIASLEDLGYEVSYTDADDYSWPPPNEGRDPFSFGVAQSASEAIDLSHDALPGPIYIVDEAGAVYPVR